MLEEGFRIRLLVLLQVFRVLPVPFSLPRAVLVALEAALEVEVGLAAVADLTLTLLLAVGLAAVLHGFPFQPALLLVLLEIRLVE